MIQPLVGLIAGFQSSPGFEAGRYTLDSDIDPATYPLFQSSPGFEAGRYTGDTPQELGGLTVPILARF